MSVPEPDIEGMVGIIERDREFQSCREKAMAVEPETAKQARWQSLLKHPSIEGGLRLGILKEWRPGGLINLGPAPGSLYMTNGVICGDKLGGTINLTINGAYEDWWIPPEKCKDGRARGGKTLTDEEFIAECERRIRGEYKRVSS